MRGWLAVLLGVASLGALAGETGYTLRSTDLKVRPFLDADTVRVLPASTRVDILLRQGGWMQVGTAQGRGWVRLLAVRLGGEATAAEDGGWLSALNLGRHPAPASATATVTTGVRGFSEEELKAARPDPAQFERMAGFAVTAPQAASFADGTLAAHSQGYYGADGKPEGGRR